MGHSRQLSSVQKPPAPADLVPSGYRQEADTTEHSPTWHTTSAPYQPPVSSWLFLAALVALQVTDSSLLFGDGSRKISVTITPKASVLQAAKSQCLRKLSPS